LRAYRRRAHPLGEFTGPIQEVLGQVSAHPGFYVSDDLESPATFGLRKPAILLPERFFALPPSMQKAIACHELLHVARRDWAWNIAEEFILALLWFHPAVWWVVRNIRLSREQAVDAEVVRLTESRRAYLGALLEMAQRESTPRSVPAPLFLREGQLAQRVALMVKEVSMSRPRLIATLLAAAAALMLTGWASARTFPLKTSPPPAGSGEADIAAFAGSAALSNQAHEPHQVDVKILKRVHIVMPHYPPSAKRAKIQGTVVLEITVDSKGDVTNIRVISGPDELVKSSVGAVKQWRYAPSPLLPARTKVTINYTLKDDPSPQSAARPAPDPEGNPSANLADHKVYEIGGNVRAPKPVYAPDPPYPHQASKAGLQGTVVMAAVVNAEGKVESVKEVSKPLGMGMDESALNTIRTWTFQPAMRNGKPVPVKITIECTFRYFGKKKPDPAATS
ncbi:MAG TPA: M56 family metallopeptidase, partial [Terriglobia bacterium]|nr:M56 family metallopeptidase [Terriglobia bacterium]